MISRISFVAAALLVPFAIACSAGEGSEAGSRDQDLSLAPESAQITAEDNGKTVTVLEGQKIVLELPGGDGDDAAYTWRVVSTSRTLGYGEEATIETWPVVQKFTWQTKGFLSTLGKHTVKLELGEEGGSAKDTFEFTVDIIKQDVSGAP